MQTDQAGSWEVRPQPPAIADTEPGWALLWFLCGSATTLGIVSFILTVLMVAQVAG